MYHSKNTIVRRCINHAILDANSSIGTKLAFLLITGVDIFKGTDHVGTFMGLKCVVYYANYRSGNQSSKIQVVP